MYTTDAWVLHRGDPDRPEPAQLRREPFTFADLAADEVLVEPLFGCWEGNYGHAIARSPIDICAARNEDKVVIGNSGVVRVLEPGTAVQGLLEGDVCMVAGAFGFDKYGHMTTVFGFDAPNTIGLMAKRTKIAARCLLPIPQGDAYSLRQWAAFSVRYTTAWSNWKVALGALRLLMSESDLPAPFVWGWGGGSTLAELDLARRVGCQTAMISGRSSRLEVIRRLGIHPVDRRHFKDLHFDEHRLRSDPEFRKRYTASERAFLDYVREHTGGEGVSIFLDYIGTPVARCTLKALSRQGVIATAGWREGTTVAYNRAAACIRRHTHVHTHGFRRSEAVDAMQYAQQTEWLPPICEELCRFDDLPLLAARFAEDAVDSYFPLFEINPP